MTQEELIQENRELKARLALAQKWMQREVSASLRIIQEKKNQKKTRKHLSNVFEEEGVDIIIRKITGIFGDALSRAPEYTLERLIDADIYWQTLQKYPTMDGLPIVLSYQKILDSYIEDTLIYPFRKSNLNIAVQKIKEHTMVSYQQQQEYEQIEKDIDNVLTRGYTLSLGRLYQVLSFVKNGATLSPLVSCMVAFWEKEIPSVFKLITSDTFFTPFSELMDREIFTKKRHESKVTYADVKLTRKVLFDDEILLSLIKASQL